MKKFYAKFRKTEDVSFEKLLKILLNSKEIVNEAFEVDSDELQIFFEFDEKNIPLKFIQLVYEKFMPCRIIYGSTFSLEEIKSGKDLFDFCEKNFQKEEDFFDFVSDLKRYYKENFISLFETIEQIAVHSGNFDNFVENVIDYFDLGAQEAYINIAISSFKELCGKRRKIYWKNITQLMRLKGLPENQYINKKIKNKIIEKDIEYSKVTAKSFIEMIMIFKDYEFKSETNFEDLVTTHKHVDDVVDCNVKDNSTNQKANVPIMPKILEMNCLSNLYPNYQSKIKKAMKEVNHAEQARLISEIFECKDNKKFIEVFEEALNLASEDKYFMTNVKEKEQIIEDAIAEFLQFAAVTPYKVEARTFIKEFVQK